MLGNIVAAFLNQPVNNDFRVLRQMSKASQVELDAAGMEPAEAVDQLPQSRSQAKLLEHGWAQRRNEAAHFEDGVLGEIARLPQPDDPIGMFRWKGVFEQLQLQPDAQQRLAG